MAGNRRNGNAVPVADLAVALLDPVLRKRAGMTIGLVQSWEEIVGERLSATTRPEKIAWPRRMHENDPFEPATLVIACEGFSAVHVQHETGEIIARVNAFLGFSAVGRIKIVQKQVAAPVRRPPRQRALTDIESARLDRLTSKIEDDDLRASLERLGKSVMAKKN